MFVPIPTPYDSSLEGLPEIPRLKPLPIKVVAISNPTPDDARRLYESFGVPREVLEGKPNWSGVRS